MLWNLFKSRRVAVGREFKPTRLVLGPWSLLLHRELDAHTFLRQSQGNKLGPTRSSGTINWQSVSRIRCPDTWPPPRSHHTLYFAHIYISAWSPRASEFVTPSQKGVPGGGGFFRQKCEEALPFSGGWNSIESQWRGQWSLFLEGTWHVSRMHQMTPPLFNNKLEDEQLLLPRHSEPWAYALKNLS